MPLISCREMTAHANRISTGRLTAQPHSQVVHKVITRHILDRHFTSLLISRLLSELTPECCGIVLLLVFALPLFNLRSTIFTICIQQIPYNTILHISRFYFAVQSIAVPLQSTLGYITWYGNKSREYTSPEKSILRQITIVIISQYDPKIKEHGTNEKSVAGQAW